MNYNRRGVAKLKPCPERAVAQRACRQRQAPFAYPPEPRHCHLNPTKPYYSRFSLIVCPAFCVFLSFVPGEVRDWARTTPRPTTCRPCAVVVGAAAAASVEMSACRPYRMEPPSRKYTPPWSSARTLTQSLPYMCVCACIPACQAPQGDPTRDHTCRPTAAGPRTGRHLVRSFSTA